MGSDLKYYDVFPRIVRSGSETVITVRPLFEHVAFTTEQPYRATLLPMKGAEGQMRWDGAETQAVEVLDGVLRVPCRFLGEQEYCLRIERADHAPADFYLYALDPDLFSRRPYKGDFHMHTHHSDGVESPAYVAAACRKIGLDFMAITDHHRYFPSIDAIDAFAGAQIDLRIYPGEEVHPPGNPVHMLNFGGSFSVNELFAQDSYESEVAEVARQIEDFPAEVDPYPYASCVWAFGKIREGGGLAVFCHPYWISNMHYDVPEALTNLIFERQPYDALELIGGYHRFEVESNALQVARYHEERAAGKRIPIVGVSDSHGCETGSLFGWYFTVAFSPTADLPDLVASINDLYSVAVEALPGETPRAFGPFRLVRYSHFLMREVFPWHDRLCAQEGSLMLEYAAGDPQAAGALQALKGQADGLYRHWWSA
jgi:hypothetical protein